MRNFLGFAFLLIAGTSGQAQSLSFNIGGQPIHVSIHGRCNDPSCVYVSVPGYVQYGLPRSGPSHVHYGSPQTVPDYVQYGAPHSYGLPADERRSSRTTRVASKRLPKVAMVHNSSPASTSADRAAALSRQPLPAVEPAPVARVAPQSQTNIVNKPLSAPVEMPPAAMTPKPAPIAPAAETPTSEPTGPLAAASGQVVAPSSDQAIPPKPLAEVVPENPLPQHPLTPQPSISTAAIAPLPEVRQESVSRPNAAATAETSTAPSASTAASHAAPDKPSKMVIAALPPAKQDIEERPKQALAMPVGVWSSSEGQMRVERCGQNLCGYAVGGKHAGKMILIHMRQTRNNHWSGQVNDVRSGQIYSARMSMRGANGLHIEGCALGGLICGGRTLSRVQ